MTKELNPSDERVTTVAAARECRRGTSPLTLIAPPASCSVLRNGTRLVVVELPAAHGVVMTAHVRTGSRFEDDVTNGLSHFLEHMLYRGTTRHPSAHEQALAFERLGSTLEASTSVDHGVMEVAIVPENFESVTRLFCEAYRDPVLDRIELERGIVREEILESLDDRGRMVDADEHLRQLSFAGHPLAFPITGTLEQLSRFDQAQLRAHHRERYVGSGTVIAVAGPVGAERIAELLDQGLGSIPHGSVPELAPPPPHPGPVFRYVRHACSQTALRLAFRAPGEHDPDEPRMELLMRLLDDGLSTRLYRRICDELGLCYDVGASYEAYSDCGIVEIGAETAHDHALDVLGELLDVMRRLRDDGPTSEELDAAKDRHGWQLSMMMDDPSSVAEFYALGELTGVARTPVERHTELLAVGLDDLRSAAQRWLIPRGLSVVAVGMLSRRAQEQLERMVRSFS